MSLLGKILRISLFECSKSLSIHFTTAIGGDSESSLWVRMQRLLTARAGCLSLLYRYIVPRLPISVTTIHTSSTGSRSISEVNLVLADLVLGWETTWE
jgi:hypothetical protein